ncbi:DUF2299 family protein [Methanobrevibacter sp. DSM 116169]|uniref:DUF2299 family protein n=1 Tax=Methanobrevibacter sp. DSM 116169 TaxID=3242727 RepID=UPI0038FCB7A9
MIDEAIIKKWLEEENLFTSMPEDENSRAHFIITYPANINNKMDIILPKMKTDCLTIGCATVVDDGLLELMKGKVDTNEQFLMEIQSIANQFLLDISIFAEPTKELKHFLITEEIFEDGLTKDFLIRSIKKVFKAKHQCLLKLEAVYGKPIPFSNNPNDIPI